MSEREKQVDATQDVDVETVVDETLAESRTDDADSRGRLDTPVTRRGLAVAVLLSTVGMVAFGVAFPVWILGALLGLFVAGFAGGLASSRRRYTEFLLSGAVAGGAWALVGNIGLALFASALPLVATGLVGGGLAAAVGHYFGRDLRDGLTREI